MRVIEINSKDVIAYRNRSEIYDVVKHDKERADADRRMIFKINPEMALSFEIARPLGKVK